MIKWLLSKIPTKTLLSVVQDMDETSGTGVQISAYYRNSLNFIGHPWQECMDWGQKFNARIEEADWLTTDQGIMFEKTFVPDKAKKQQVYGRVFIPDWALFDDGTVMDMDYAPWILMHTDRRMLTDAVLLEKWKYVYSKEDDDVLDTFYDLLKHQGYYTAFMEEPILVLEVT